MYRASLFYFSFISSTKIILVSNNYTHFSLGRTKITNWFVWLYEWKTVSVIQRLWCIVHLLYSCNSFLFIFVEANQLILTGLIWTELNCTDDSGSTCDISHFYVINTHTNTHRNEFSYSNTTLGNLERLHPLTLRLSRLAKTMISCHSRSSAHAKRGANALLDTY